MSTKIGVKIFTDEGTPCLSCQIDGRKLTLFSIDKEFTFPVLETWIEEGGLLNLSGDFAQEEPLPDLWK
jgi:hypothetical protein